MGDTGLKVEEDENSDEDGDGDNRAGAKGGPGGGLDVTKIDAHWLQREIGAACDPAKLVETEKKVLELLPISDVAQLENALFQLLDQHNFDFLRLLVKNRTKI